MMHDFLKGGKDFIQCTCGKIFRDGKKDEFDTAKNKFLEHLQKNGLWELSLDYGEIIVK